MGGGHRPGAVPRPGDGEVTARAVAEFRAARADGRLARLPEVPEADMAALLARARDLAAWFAEPHRAGDPEPPPRR